MMGARACYIVRPIIREGELGQGPRCRAKIGKLTSLNDAPLNYYSHKVSENNEKKLICNFSALPKSGKGKWAKED